MSAEADALGVTLTTLEAEKIKKTDDALRKMKGATEGLAQTLTTELGPALAGVITEFAQNLPESIKLARKAMDEFWLVFDPDRASVHSQMEEVSKDIARVAAEIRDMRKQQVDEGLDGAIFGQHFDKMISEKRATLDDLYTQFDELNTKFNQETPALKIDITEGNQTPLVEDENKKTLEQRREFYARLYELDEEAQDRTTALVAGASKERLWFASQSATQQTQHVIGEAINLTRGVAAQNKTLFKINKAAGIANATIAAYEGASMSLKTYPWPLAGVMAALHLAAGFANVQAIRSQSFGGGGGAPSNAASGGTPSNPVPQTPPGGFSNTDEPARGSSMTINLGGPILANDDFRAYLVDAIEAAQSNDEIRIIN